MCCLPPCAVGLISGLLRLPIRKPGAGRTAAPELQHHTMRVRSSSSLTRLPSTGSYSRGSWRRRFRPPPTPSIARWRSRSSRGRSRRRQAPPGCPQRPIVLVGHRRWSKVGLLALQPDPAISHRGGQRSATAKPYITPRDPTATRCTRLPSAPRRCGSDQRVDRPLAREGPPATILTWTTIPSHSRSVRGTCTARRASLSFGKVALAFDADPSRPEPCRRNWSRGSIVPIRRTSA